MKKEQELLKAYHKNPEYKNFHANFQFNMQTKNWEFKGYRCIKCDRVLQRNSNGVPKHNEICKEINKVLKNKGDEVDLSTTKVINLKREPWYPKDFNQN